MATICASLEGCIIAESHHSFNDYHPTPIPHVLERLRDAKRTGHKIIVYTCRKKLFAREIETVLKNLQVPYDELAFDRPSSDSSMMEPSFDCAAEDQTTDSDSAPEEEINAEEFGFVASRSFNKVEVFDSTVVVKSSSAAPIRGELFFYSHVPYDILHLFPTLLRRSPGESGSTDLSWSASSITSDIGFEDDLELSASCEAHQKLLRNGLVSICMSREDGPTLSHLLTSRCLTPGRLRTLIYALHEIHSSNGKRHHCECSSRKVDIYSNYSRKLKGRLRQYSSEYQAVRHIITSRHLEIMFEMLSSYEGDERGFPVRVMHGDPVLSNVISLSDGSVKFIDMRGMQGDEVLTLAGDGVYDLAKVFQSLSNYDYIIRDRGIEVRDSDTLTELRSTFRSCVKAMYPTVKFRDIVLVASSLYASLLPLHDNPRHRLAFAERSVSLLDEVQASVIAGENDIP